MFWRKWIKEKHDDRRPTTDNGLFGLPSFVRRPSSILLNMHTLPPHRQTLLTALSRLYFYTYWSTLRRVLGIRLSQLIKGIPLLLTAVALISRWPLPLLILLATLSLLIQIIYRHAKRRSYKSFVADPAPPPPLVPPLPANQRVKLWATGTFSLNDREATVLLAPAEYWFVPLGEHIIMVEQLPKQYLYQFFNATTIQKVEIGWLAFGNTPKRSLALTFALNWGPEFADYGNLYLVPDKQKEPPPRTRTVYFSFADDAELTAVFSTIHYPVISIQ